MNVSVFVTFTFITLTASLVLSNGSKYFQYVLIINQVHAVSRTQQSMQREPGIKTLHSLLSIKFWQHCVLSGETQRRALPRRQSREMQKFQIFH